ncbi:hypothetical protein [Mediterraneibacter glycyrrhizinilyticus]|uniref:hypothetical protein n=1 Tax=Mediterraneibacter glycyrrhizinilyticus TaxID=342942 RepID=UPI0025AA3FFE|nr:hypothetical protein [Mediterraneibacter glycyrrhizinilyticus]MDN0043782.1 hypothetical protein [Mediterraneibacter glycyrrhizinilyticus]
MKHRSALLIRNEGGGSGEPTTPTLTSIIVTWSADSADVGTDPKTLISSVKANYSDGASQTVTEYTVTPTSLVEGNNIVTVTYNGKSATKSITGVAEQIGGAEVVMLAPVQKSGATVTDYSDGGHTAFVGSTTDNSNRWMVRSEKVFDKDTVLHVQMSRDSQTYNAVDLFSCDTEVWDGVSAVKENGYGFYGVKTVDSATWVNPFSLDTKYTVKAGYAFMYCTYSAIDASTLNVMITEVA